MVTSSKQANFYTAFIPSISCTSMMLKDSVYRVNRQFFDQTLRPSSEQTITDRSPNFFFIERYDIWRHTIFYSYLLKNDVFSVKRARQSTRLETKCWNFWNRQFRAQERNSSGNRKKSQKVPSFHSSSLRWCKRLLSHLNRLNNNSVGISGSFLGQKALKKGACQTFFAVFCNLQLNYNRYFQSISFFLKL